MVVLQQKKSGFNYFKVCIFSVKELLLTLSKLVLISSILVGGISLNAFNSSNSLDNLIKYSFDITSSRFCKLSIICLASLLNLFKIFYAIYSLKPCFINCSFVGAIL